MRDASITTERTMQTPAQVMEEPGTSVHRLPADDIIDYTLSKMQARLDGTPGSSGQERNGLLFTGNIHDAYPRALILDMRLSPLDKMCWIMIRQYALQNDGAIFPSYDELQKLLSSPGSGQASRDTVSRALTMLRLTGWLSLCKRVRDNGGRVRGNIYAQHDEPVSAKDAEMFDPGWLDMVGKACQHKYREVSDTAFHVLNGILDDPMMRHRHSRMTEIAERLTRPSKVGDVARTHQNPGTGLSLNSIKNEHKSLSPVNRPGCERGVKSPSPDSRLSLKSDSYDRVRQPDCNNVRSFTQSVIKKTYVSPQSGKNAVGGIPEGFVWPDGLQSILPESEQPMLAQQLNQLAQKSPVQAEQIALSVVNGWHQKRISNPVGYLLTTLRQARAGLYRLEPAVTQPVKSRSVVPAEPSAAGKIPTCSAEADVPAGQEVVKAMVEQIRQRMNASQ
ncbi:helix-turn-helix domain-containing protein [Salmonella enterica subsp. enterica serovar Rauform]|uniref:Helix-turn-helix domain-containing protein n=2 Tax=Salmonella TaxID=590 RepID=F2Q881_SALBN|nr:helix-turn-helix domain-containing protein [Salmonella enterica subsp. enterica serovar Kambole]EBS1106794.1 helix-turn-helix domain-containing protein [Salmonella enterica subsp. enterica serovar Eingedi]EBV2191044.1 helix-turn-helix domain-containing protein [Salmonella enterica subsp. enterica serovar Afula]EBW2023102.1 helix-turn-helix domain-containing protein [Salmonella enterica subsp. enterica serovar Enteritidis]ECF1907898.1 helix-turn-helix domain-containing protein [Salmonella ent